MTFIPPRDCLYRPSGGSAIRTVLLPPLNKYVLLLTSTNVALPLTNWTPIATNRFDGSGQFNLTNGINPGVPQQFYILSQ